MRLRVKVSLTDVEGTRISAEEPLALVLDDVLSDFLGELLVDAELGRLLVELLDAAAAHHVAVEARGDVRRHKILQ